jgi:hypothetical protein
MAFFRRLAALSCVIGLVACLPQILIPPADPFETPPADASAANACGAGGMQDMVGKPFSVLAAMTLPAQTRLISPDSAVTMDFNAKRLNIFLDAAGMISSVRCG